MERGQYGEANWQMGNKKLMIRSSTAEFLIFEKQNHSDGIEIRYEDGTLFG